MMSVNDIREEYEEALLQYTYKSEFTDYDEVTKKSYFGDKAFNRVLDQLLAIHNREVERKLEDIENTLNTWYHTSKNHPLEDMDIFIKDLFKHEINQLKAKGEDR